MSLQAASNPIDIPALSAPITVVRVPTIRNFLDEMRHDAGRVRHREVRWSTQTITCPGEHHVTFDLLTAGYIAEDDHPKLIELRLPCGRLGLSRREQDIAGQEQIAAALELLQRATQACELDWRAGRLSLDPSPLMPTTGDVLRRLCSTINTPEGTTYAPWTDGWAIGVECRRRDGYRTLLYLNPSGETEEGDGSVFVYQGTSGSPAEDMPAHRYDPFTAPEPTQWFTVRTDNADRQWRATSEQEARRLHHEAFGGLRGENILVVLMPAKAEPQRTP